MSSLAFTIGRGFPAGMIAKCDLVLTLYRGLELGDRIQSETFLRARRAAKIAIALSTATHRDFAIDAGLLFQENQRGSVGLALQKWRAIPYER